MPNPVADEASLNDRIRLLKKWIPIAAQGLISFYRSDKGVFWRDNAWAQDQEQETAKQDIGDATKEVGKKFKYSPTSTARSFFAICEYLRFLHEEELNPDQSNIFSGDFKTCRTILNDVTNKFLAQLIDVKTRPIVLESQTNLINPFYQQSYFGCNFYAALFQVFTGRRKETG
jgi:hypothetical protein